MLGRCEIIGRSAALLVCLGVVALAGPARADDDDDVQAPRTTWEFMPGPAREIPRTESASRDAAALEFAYGPRAEASLGAEFGLIAARTPHRVVTVGMYAMWAMENVDQKQVFPPIQVGRGLVGFTASYSLAALARRVFGQRGAMEVSVTVGHESDHAIANPMLPAPRPDDIRDTEGNFAAPDAAVRAPLGPTEVTARLANRLYWEGAIRDAPSLDLAVRWRALPGFLPTAALYAEKLFARDRGARTGGSLRLMTGAVVPGHLGEVFFFSSLELGDGRGLLVNQRETRIALGVRYTPFTPR